MRLIVNVERAREVIGERLTSREWHIFLRLIAGASTREMADEWGILTNGILQAKSRIMRKLEVATIAEVVVFAVENGIVTSEKLVASAHDKERNSVREGVPERNVRLA